MAAAGATATIDATPSGPNNSESTHTVVVELGAEAGSTGQQLNDIVVDYSVDQPTASVSNVGAGTIERVGVDRDGDNMGTRIDENATITSVAGMKNGAAVQVSLAGNLTLEEGDEVVLVLTPVQNPQNAGDATVTTTINSQSAADTANATVTYEAHDATATLTNKTTSGETVTVDSVELSEGGFVAVQTQAGANPGSVVGVSEYLSPGQHSDVTVELDESLEENQSVVVQSYMDTNGDLRYNYVDSGAEEDGLYLNTDGNPIGEDTAYLTIGSTQSTSTDTATPADSTTTSSDTDDSDSSDGSDDSDSSDGSDSTTEMSSGSDDSDSSDGSSDGDSDSSSSSTETTSPGFGVVVAALAILAAAGFATRQTN